MVRSLLYPRCGDQPSLALVFAAFFLQIVLLTALSATLTSPISPFQSIKLAFPFVSPPMFSGAASLFQNVYFPIIASDNQPTGPSKILLTFLPVPLYFLARTSSRQCANDQISLQLQGILGIKKSPSYKHRI